MACDAYRHRGSVLTLIVVIVAIILILGYYGISIQRDIVQNPTNQSNFSYVWTQLADFWNNYLKAPVLAVWRWAVANVLNLPVQTGSNGITIPQITSTLEQIATSSSQGWNILH